MPRNKKGKKAKKGKQSLGDHAAEIPEEHGHLPDADYPAEATGEISSSGELLDRFDDTLIEIAHRNAMAEVSGSENIMHYDNEKQVPAALKKYWAQRRLLFSKYDEGIWLTNDAWFEVTPESIAKKIAGHIAKAAPAKKSIIIDAFAGVGGNAIAFALSGRWEIVFAIEKDADTLKCAKHNAELYGVADKIWWIHGDCFEKLKTQLKGRGADAVIFASPPWGGPGYSDQGIFDLSQMQPYNLHHLYDNFSSYADEIVLYLPRSSNLNQLAAYVLGDIKGQVVQYCMCGASKALGVYYGNFDRIEQR